jgi:hypothetical protein
VQGAGLEKYEPLRDHLAGYAAGDQLLLSFREIEELVGPLPRGARRLRQWWNNKSTAQARAWRAAGWRVRLADIGTEQVLFERLLPRPTDSPPADAADLAVEREDHSYLADIHLPLLGVLVVFSVIIGAVGFALRPGTDEPPVVLNSSLTLYVDRAGTPAHVAVDEIMLQQDPSTVLVQLDIFASFTTPGPVSWELLASRSSSQPYSCPDPYTYFGTAQPDPVNDAGGVTIEGQPVTGAQLRDFTGHVSDRTASNVLGLFGQAPGTVKAGDLAPVGEVDLCWKSNLPMAFDGEFVTTSLPGINAYSEPAIAPLPVSLTRTLYFDNPHENLQPLTAEYSLQAGTLPTSTDPTGWHWAAGQGDGTVQLTATNIQISQHEAYLGFLSGVLFGVVGGALVLILQELLEPIRLKRRTRGEKTA